MARYCFACERSFPTSRAVAAHVAKYHRHPRREHVDTTKIENDFLTAQPCNSAGIDLPDGSPPPPRDMSQTWEQFEDRPTFEFAELVIEKMQASKGDINALLEKLAAKAKLHHSDDPPIYPNYDAILRDVDEIKLGVAEWDTWSFGWDGAVDANSKPWKHKRWFVHARNPRELFQSQLSNPDFAKGFDSVPFAEFKPDGKRRYQNFMSGMWANEEAELIRKTCPTARGAMLSPIILGADKTTVSVATGDTEFHPVYGSLGNFHNDLRRGHGEAVGVIAFLAIPKGSKEDNEDAEFRLFKKQAYHGSLKHILDPLRDAMSTPVVMRCPDGHFRRVIFSIGPFMADYPEQVYLAAIVQDWCPKCLIMPDHLHDEGDPRFRELDEVLRAGYPSANLWDAFGIADGVKPFTEHFPRADIHELLSPDLLHQLIKGTFKDHLFEWVLDYFNDRERFSARQAKKKIAELDRRLRAIPTFPGLRRFKDGRNFKQWTGDDSKALMKIVLPALRGLIPDRIVQCMATFLDFCYLARRSNHDEDSLELMDETLARFQDLRRVFLDLGIRDNFNLPRQHALVHYVRSIRLFGSPNGLCTSITESKHIKMVKEPWRRSSRFNALPEILKWIDRLGKIAAFRADRGRRGMFDGDVLYDSRRLAAAADADADEAGRERRTNARLHRFTRAERDAHEGRHDNDVLAVYDDEDQPSVRLAAKPHCSREIELLPVRDRIKDALPELISRFLFDQLYADDFYITGEEADLEDCPEFEGNVGLYRSARATFYAPSELCGPEGMHSEVIRSNPSWYGQYARYDTVLIQNDDDDAVMGGMLVGRVLAFVGFTHERIRYSAAVVEWFEPVGDAPDPITGMWILRPRVRGGEREIGLVHTDCIVRACQVIGVYGREKVPDTLHHSQVHDAFDRFYFNKYSDYHTHECYPV